MQNGANSAAQRSAAICDCSGKTILADNRPNLAASPPTYRALARLLRGGAPPAQKPRATRDEQRMADSNGFDLLNCQRTIAAVWRDHFPRAIMNYEF
jgi:hypothetical protein